MGARRTKGCIVLALVFAVLHTPATAAGEPRSQPDRILPGCGICYPGGYDLNTVGSLAGRILAVETPEDGPARLWLEADGGERWVVLASPAWHWREAGLRLRAGDEVLARGSKTLGSDGVLYLVAQEIRSEGSAATAVVRDGQGRPLWSRSRQGGGHGRGRAHRDERR